MADRIIDEGTLNLTAVGAGLGVAAFLAPKAFRTPLLVAAAGVGLYSFVRAAKAAADKGAIETGAGFLFGQEALDSLKEGIKEGLATAETAAFGQDSSAAPPELAARPIAPVVGELAPPLSLAQRDSEVPLGAYGLVSGGLTEKVVAYVKRPRKNATARRAPFGSTFPATIVIANLTTSKQSVDISYRLQFRNLLSLSPTQLDRRLFLIGLKPGETIERDVSIDTESTFDIGDLRVVMTLHVSGRQTNSTEFVVK
jgi:hypothetical protein